MQEPHTTCILINGGNRGVHVHRDTPNSVVISQNIPKHIVISDMMRTGGVRQTGFWGHSKPSS
ncbi:hypothetical protein PISMIDRAFT_684090 [Pisolithus microcarpus 441]|uniref:Uncharacterized protein n=1 Tax=Pisolithus microcarpus 441 TaxID=765257 RepID=A0A0C9YXB9_9AGAM|nr:hypothetical protein PISMIDRAFT_684090 [Pisolithus microcarpus 441]